MIVIVHDCGQTLFYRLAGMNADSSTINQCLSPSCRAEPSHIIMYSIVEHDKTLETQIECKPPIYILAQILTSNPLFQTLVKESGDCCLDVECDAPAELP